MPAGTCRPRKLRIVVALGVKLTLRARGSVSVLTPQRSTPHATCLE